jgi:hypothetical protein
MLTPKDLEALNKTHNDFLVLPDRVVGSTYLCLPETDQCGNSKKPYLSAEESRKQLALLESDRIRELCSKPR